MAPVTRYDIGELQSPRRDARTGFLRGEARLTRTGVFEYRNADGSVRRELRTDEEVNASMDSAAMAPVTDDHPPAMLTAENAKQYQKGHLGESVKRDGQFVRAPLLVTDADLIAKMEAGKRQVSLGYTCDLDPTPGVYNGIKYDAVQRGITVNHAAIVERGRAGAACAVRMDAGEYVEDATWSAAMMNDLPDSAFLYVEPGGEKDGDGKTTPRSLRHFPVKGPDGAVDLPHLRDALSRIPQSNVPAAAKEAATAKARALLKEHGGQSNTDGVAVSRTFMEEQIKKLQAELDQAKADASKQAARADAAEAELAKEQKARKDAEDPARFRVSVQGRVALEKAAGAVLGDVKLDAMTDRDIKLAVVAKLSSEVPAERKDDASYVEAAYEYALKSASANVLAKLRQTTDAASKSQPVSDLDKARADHDERVRNLHKQPINGAATREGMK